LQLSDSFTICPLLTAGIAALFLISREPLPRHQKVSAHPHFRAASRRRRFWSRPLETQQLAPLIEDRNAPRHPCRFKISAARRAQERRGAVPRCHWLRVQTSSGTRIASSGGPARVEKVARWSPLRNRCRQPNFFQRLVGSALRRRRDDCGPEIISAGRDIWRFGVRLEPVRICGGNTMTSPRVPERLRACRSWR